MSGTVPRISNRGELVAAVLAWLDNRPADGELAATMGAAIGLAEEQIAAELRVRSMVARDTLAVEAREVALPSDWLEAIGVRLVQPQRYALLPLSELDAANHGSGGNPRYYAVRGDQLEIVPEQGAGSGASIELEYYAKPPALQADDDTHDTLLSHASVYLYAVLLQTCMLLRDDERQQRWAGLYSAMRDAANLAWQRARFSGGPLNARIRRA